MIIMMHIYHALINALSAHMIHINLNMIFYTHVEHSPTKTIYIKYYTKKQQQQQPKTNKKTKQKKKTPKKQKKTPSAWSLSRCQCLLVVLDISIPPFIPPRPLPPHLLFFHLCLFPVSDSAFPLLLPLPPSPNSPLLRLCTTDAEMRTPDSMHWFTTSFCRKAVLGVCEDPRDENSELAKFFF